ncbi:L-alanine exporter AlaE [Vibrio sp. MACH09]|uniref:L-alanine exporter AlaE n=1 Tax=unclassified Vibrio TaxID=2614977 RepID=UPI00149357AF|nr:MULTISPECIES: L-alanine exporter AlaE [unclassified Vibrio]NOI66493.1 L-alanine exporter AlaE [Vibrio sp. 99-8-1]GLO60506.1 L-alanine exporter AlaE [Vibrio sp. MACH09]
MKARSPFSVRNVAADMFAMVVFCFVTGMITEVVISGISFETSLASRTLAIPVNILIALPYGIFRDKIMKLAAKLSTTRLMKNGADLFAFVAFQSPVYIAILMVVGASEEQIIAAVTSSIAMFSVLGVLYGYFLDVCRRWFRVPGYYQQV